MVSPESNYMYYDDDNDYLKFQKGLKNTNSIKFTLLELPIGLWNLSSVTTMKDMFRGATQDPPSVHKIQDEKAHEKARARMTAIAEKEMNAAKNSWKEINTPQYTRGTAKQREQLKDRARIFELAAYRHKSCLEYKKILPYVVEYVNTYKIKPHVMDCLIKVIFYALHEWISSDPPEDVMIIAHGRFVGAGLKGNFKGYTRRLTIESTAINLFGCGRPGPEQDRMWGKYVAARMMQMAEDVFSLYLQVDRPDQDSIRFMHWKVTHGPKDSPVGTYPTRDSYIYPESLFDPDELDRYFREEGKELGRDLYYQYKKSVGLDVVSKAAAAEARAARPDTWPRMEPPPGKFDPFSNMGKEPVAIGGRSRKRKTRMKKKSTYKKLCGRRFRRRTKKRKSTRRRRRSSTRSRRRRRTARR